MSVIASEGLSDCLALIMLIAMFFIVRRICSQKERQNNDRYMKDEALAQDKHNMELLAVEEMQFQVKVFAK